MGVKSSQRWFAKGKAKIYDTEVSITPMCKVKISRAVQYPVRIQACLLFVVPRMGVSLHSLPPAWLIREALKIAGMVWRVKVLKTLISCQS